ncbi:hypothetical protein U9R90_26945 [Streptomyces sp. E11-3]|uniref:hypothetical protein n=1 Tax=Streptomyces sp. E11-3 TaxID=3110112 RepID=UPI00398180A9
MSKSAFWQRVVLILLIAIVVFALIVAGCAPQVAVGIAAAIVLIARDVWNPAPSWTEPGDSDTSPKAGAS